MSNQLSQGHRKMMDYINDKYDDTFTFVSIYGGTPGSDVHKIWVSSAAYPDKLISVECVDQGDSLLFFDNYLSVKYEDRTRELLYSLCARYGKKAKVLYTVSNLAGTAGGANETTFEEYIGEPTSMIMFTAIIDTESPVDQSIVETVKNDILKAGLCCMADFYFCSNDPDLEKITMDNIFVELIRDKSYDAKLYLNMTASDTFKTVDWEVPQ